LARLALEEGISVFVVMGDDPRELERFANEVAPATRELVAAGREAAGEEDAPDVPSPAPPVHADDGDAAEPPPDSEYARLGVSPTPDDGSRLAAPRWDESSRPHRTPSGPDVTYSETGRQTGQHLIDVHDHLRKELTELREVVAQVRDGALSAGQARDALHAMALRQNDWTLGAFCARYCRVVAQHHTIEDQSVFPHLRSADPELAPVVDRLADEHLVIHDAIEEVDRALVHHLEHPEDFDRLQTAIDVLTDTLLSHLAYEEHELVEPLARLGFQPTRL
ncbi:MAG TPA: hemerythrin domain-containing protein, partial [Solirubrobacterales bacterium]|nr:hemerythrin domain-containing protein [Solirubrobacterales bacterium]